MALVPSIFEPACKQAAWHIFDGESVRQVVAPLASDVDVALAGALESKTQLLDHPPTRLVLWSDVCLDPVQTPDAEAMVDHQRQRGRHDPLARMRFRDPVAEVRRVCRTSRDRADRHLPGELLVDQQREGIRQTEPRITT